MIDSTKNGTQELMESGGKSPWGNKDVRGYVKWEKKSEVDANGNSQTKFTYGGFNRQNRSSIITISGNTSKLYK